MRRFEKYHEVYITGGAGFIGSHIVEAIAGSHEVVVIDNYSSGKQENLSTFSDTIDQIQGSITDLPLLMDTCSGADGIFHLAAIASVARSVAILSPHMRPISPAR